jgi:hypothetical protein
MYNCEFATATNVQLDYTVANERELKGWGSAIVNKTRALFVFKEALSQDFIPSMIL